MCVAPGAAAEKTRPISTLPVVDGVWNALCRQRELECGLLGRAEKRTRAEAPEFGEARVAGAITLGRRHRVRFAVSTPGIGTGQVPEQPLLLAVDAAPVFHEGAVEMVECLGDFRAALHREHAVRSEAEGLDEDLRDARDLARMVSRQGCHKRGLEPRQARAPIRRRELSPADRRATCGRHGRGRGRRSARAARGDATRHSARRARAPIGSVRRSRPNAGARTPRAAR